MMHMTDDYIIQQIKANFGGSIQEISEPSGLLTIVVPKEKNIEVISWLFKNEELQFTFLTDLTGIHYPENKGMEMSIIYHLHSFVHNIRLRIKIFVSAENPVVPSMTPVFKSANWMERETYDFFGIIFQGHPNLKRILNMDEMDYFPMQKQYPLEDQQRDDKEDKFFGR